MQALLLVKLMHILQWRWSISELLGEVIEILDFYIIDFLSFYLILKKFC